MPKSKYRKLPIEIEAIQWTGDNYEEVSIFINKTLRINQHEIIDTLEGIMRVDINDWIIKGVNGEFYPCKPDIFEKTYEPVESEES